MSCDLQLQLGDKVFWEKSILKESIVKESIVKESIVKESIVKECILKESSWLTVSRETWYQRELRLAIAI